MVFVEMVVAVIVVLATVLPAQGVIGRNAFVGIRTRSLMRDDRAWTRGHRAAVLPTAVAAAVTIVVGAVFAVTGRENDTRAVLVCAALILLGASWAAAAAARAVR